jgi:gliding motility-associated-like protein
MKSIFTVVSLLISSILSAQLQVCPLNSNFSTGTLTHWQAYTGNNAGGNGPRSIKQIYDSTATAPTGTIGTTVLYEYNLPSVAGIQILGGTTRDPYGGFLTVPNINGYQYTNSILLGSTSITRSSGNGAGGGYVRGVRYNIHVPPGPTSEPYTMTYAYAMILENGTHNSDQQPLFSATLAKGDSVITCASPRYFLPTFNNAVNGGTGALLDSATAKAEGFYEAALPSPNVNPNGSGGSNDHLYDVWAKGWTEVTFDLSPYRGDSVTLTFETDNCVPGGHFAYSYVALRNTCAGLQISGPVVACIGGDLTYSIPSLAGASYNWSVPPDWQITGGSSGNILTVHVGNQPGSVIAHEVNSCANMLDTLQVTTSPPTIPGTLSGDNRVCSGNNASLITLTGNRGNVLNWLASTDGGIHYSTVDVDTTIYDAQNLLATTIFKAVIQNGQSCAVDTSTGVTILVDPKSVGGKVTPQHQTFCLNQTKNTLISLVGDTGDIVNWQTSPDGITWSDFGTPYTQTSYSPSGLVTPVDYRVIVKSGVCPADTSAPAIIDIVPVQFPQAVSEPADTSICYNTTATLNAQINIGSQFTWTNSGSLTNQGDGTVNSNPYLIQATAAPRGTTQYVLAIINTGCPNALLDTFLVRVVPPIIVFAGNDTSVVVGQPLQLNAVSNDTVPPGDSFAWNPIIGLNNADIPNPVANYGPETDSVLYTVTATSSIGCVGVAQVRVKVFKTGPDIFVPNAFTPGLGVNNVFRPIPVGIATLNFFRVYNRWGQLVYSTSKAGEGWDGRVNGTMQDSGSYVWMVQGKAYTGKVIFHKGTMVLVR